MIPRFIAPGFAPPRPASTTKKEDDPMIRTTAEQPTDAPASKCPFRGGRVGGAFGSSPQINDWWPNRLQVELLHQNPPQANPLHDVDYERAFAGLDFAQLKADLREFMTDIQDWWPADYGHYGPLMVRLAWHAAGTYRIADGRGGASPALQRFAPTSSWWDNGNLDKARRLLWPIKQKYGTSISWGDLIILAGNVAMETMGFETFGFAGGRRDAWEPDRGMYFGTEFWDGKSVTEYRGEHGLEGRPTQMVTRTKRWTGQPGDADYDLEAPLAASHQSLIYVDPEGPRGDGDPYSAAGDIRETFTRMAMNDEETVALIAGGHAFGKSHGKVSADKIGPAPEGAPIQAMGLGWQNPEGTGFAEYTMTNGIEGSWTPNPIRWDNDYLKNLFKYDWELTKSPTGANQYKPKDPDAPKTPDAHIEGQDNELMMMATDLALKVDPEYRKICERFLEDFDYFSDCFARAWFKLTHRDMGPKSRYLGPEVPSEDLIWQDPIPAVEHELIDDADIAALKEQILDSGLSVSELVSAAWSAASSYRDSDKRGGANGARVALEPQNAWPVNRPDELANVLNTLRGIQNAFNDVQADGGSGGTSDNGAPGGKRVSLADLIVLGGCAAVERAAKDAGVECDVPFTPGRADCTQDQTDVESFQWLQPVADGFRNYMHEGIRFDVPAERLFLDRANLLTLTAPEWTVLTGGLRVLDQNTDHSKLGVFTDTPGKLTNDFFRTLCSMQYQWTPADNSERVFNLVDRATGETKHTATRCDLIFGSNAQLRAIAEVYAADDGHERMVKDFVAAWNKVMMLDRFDVRPA
jgi:catalase-peroxidase